MTPTEATPGIVVIAGPNGSGKSTLAPSLLRTLHIDEYLNADDMAARIDVEDDDERIQRAARAMWRRLRELAAERKSFAFETTLAGRSPARWLGKRLDDGYEVHIVYLWLPVPELALRRVAGRVRLGGHHVNEEIVRRRFESGLRNFFELYRPVATTWRVYDTSRADAPRPVASGVGPKTTRVSDPQTWRRIRDQGGAPEED